MGIEDKWLIGLGMVFYAAAFTGSLMFLLRDKRIHPSITFTLVLSGWILQTIGLYLRGLEVGGCPLGNVFEILQFVVWSLILLYLLVGTTFRISLLGFFSAGLATLLGVGSMVVPGLDDERSPWMEGVSYWVELHAALALFSYGVFAILALTSGMYLLRHYSLKKKQFQGMFHFLPSLKQLEEMKFRLLATGLLLLSISLLIGMVNWSQIDGQVQVSKLWITVALWVAYLVVFLFRLRQTLTTKTMAWACLGLFLLALISLGPINASRASTGPFSEITPETLRELSGPQRSDRF